ncbi:type II secretion system F family protein [bacterium]|nr:type II secretion system F family protein [bacterium]
MPLARRVTLREQALVFRELATLVAAGLTLLECLDELEKRPLSEGFRRFLKAAKAKVSAGRKLSEALREQGPVFSELTTALIEAGEEGGRLEEMLRDVATYLERELELRRMLARETFYPKILLCACLLIPLAANSIVAGVTKGATAGVMTALRGLTMYALVGGLPVLAVYLVYQHLAGTRTGRDLFDGAKLQLPLVGGIVQRLALSKFARALSALYAAGVHYPKAIELSADACGNRHLAALFRAAIPYVERGGTLSEVLLQSRLRNSLLVRFLQTGEQSGEIDAMLAKAADHFGDEAETQVRRLAVTIVPIGVVLAGVVVCVILAQMYLGYAHSLVP